MVGNMMEYVSSIGYSLAYNLLFLLLIPALILCMRCGYRFAHYGSRAGLVVGDRYFPISAWQTEVGFGKFLGIDLSPVFNASAEGKRTLFTIVFNDAREAYEIEPDPGADLALERDGADADLRETCLLENGDIIRFLIDEEEKEIGFKVGNR